MKRVVICLIAISVIFGCGSESDEPLVIVPTGPTIDTCDMFFINNPNSHLTYISDSIFEQILINRNFDNLHNGWVYTSSIDTITFLDLNRPNGEKIKDLSGIENFTSLKYLDVSGQQLECLDLSRNGQLVELDCEKNRLKSLNIRNNNNLKKINCSYNRLSFLSLKNVPSLTYLNAWENTLSILNVNECVNIDTLFIKSGQDLVLDFTNLTNLRKLFINDLFNDLNLENNMQLTNLQVSNINAEIKFNENNMQISRLSLTQVHRKINLNLSTFPLLNYLNISGDSITGLDFSMISNLNTIGISSTRIESIDLSNAYALNSLGIVYNPYLTHLNIKNSNNSNIINPDFRNNSSLSCIQVDNYQYSLINWLNIDSNTYFSDICP